MIRESEKQRLLTNIRVLAYLCSFGLLLIFTGGAFVIFPNAKLHFFSQSENDEPTKNVTDKTDNKTQVSVEYVPSVTSSFVFPLSVVGYVILAVGLFLIGLGFPLICRCWKRYQMMKDIERCPMLLEPYFHEEINKNYGIDRKRKKVGTVKKKSLEQNKQLPPIKEDCKSLVGEKKSRFWSRKNLEVSDDAFRIAAHHHPSFNLVPIEGLASLSRDQSEDIISLSDENMSEDNKKSSSQTKLKALKSEENRKIFQFVRTLFNFSEKNISTAEGEKVSVDVIPKKQKSKSTKTNEDNG